MKRETSNSFLARTARLGRAMTTEALALPRQSGRAALVLLMMLLTTATTWAQKSVNLGGYNFYVETDADGSYYKVDCPEALNALASYVNAGNKAINMRFKQTADIVYDTNSNYEAIGAWPSAFCGIFDGQGHTISGIDIYKGGSASADQYQGLFSQIEYPAQVKNVILADATITSHNTTGAIVGCNYHGTVENCHVLATVTVHTVKNDVREHGGIVGYNTGTVTRCTSAAALTTAGSSSKEIGGIVGDNNGTVTDCIYLGTTLAGASDVGAIAGSNGDGGTVGTCYYTDTSIHGKDDNAATLDNAASAVGYNDNGTVTNSGLAHIVTLGDGVALADATGNGRVTAYGNFALSYNDGTSATIYSLAGSEIALAYNGTGPDGYTFNGYTASAGTLNGSTLTMPNQDVTIGAIFATIDWATQSAGTADEPYLIYNKDQLDLLAHRVNGTHGETATDYSGKHFRLEADIAYDHTGLGDTGSNYEAIGGYFGGGYRSFCGTFDGQGYIVSGIRIYKGGTANADQYQGLFGKIDSPAQVKNVILADATITGYRYIGGIAGHNTGTVTDCIYLGTTLDGASYVGAIAGSNGDGGTVGTCYYTDTSIHGKDNNAATLDNAASAVGYNDNGTVTNCGLAHIVTLGDGVALADATGNGRMTVYGNFALSYNDGTSATIYSTAGSVIALVYSSTIPDGYVPAFIANGEAISGTTLTMPAEDVTIVATFSTLDWATQSAGTADDPYLIYTKDQLDLLAHRVNHTWDTDYSGKHFRLEADIVYDHTGLGDTDSNYEGIGGHFDDFDWYFRGTFDGQNHIVSGIRIYKGGDADADNNQGLFGLIDSPGLVKNVILADATITGYDYTGAIVGDNFGGTVENCHVLSNVTVHTVQSNSRYHGGITGHNYGNVTRCTSAATITGYRYIGGIAGHNTGTVTDCIYLGTTLAGTSYVGAIAGANDGTIGNSYFTDASIHDNAASAALRDDADNSGFLTLMAARNEALTAVSRTPALSTAVDVTLNGRTLYKDGNWNTLCLPFSLATLTGTPLDGFTIKELDTETAYNGHKTGFDDGTLYLNFKDAESIVAGRAYIVKWDTNGVDVDDQTPVINPSDEFVAALGFISEVPTYDNGQASNWNPDGEGPAKLVDGNTGTKYALSNDNPWVEFHYASAITPKGYALWTANDGLGTRNPRSWTIKAKNSGDADWTILVTVDNSDGDKLPKANNQRTVFALGNNSAYQYFRFEAVKGSEFQLAELQFCTVQPEIMSGITNPKFTGVTIDASAPTAVTSEDGTVSFMGSYNPISIAGEDRSILFLGAANALYYPNDAMTISSCCANFQLNGITAADPSTGVREYVLNFGDGDETRGIVSDGPVILVDGNAYDWIYDQHVPSVIYLKTLGEERVGKHQAWLVPFDYTLTATDLEKFTFYKINMIANSPSPSVETSDEMWVFLTRLSAGDVLHANMPYVYKPLQAVTDYEFTTTNTTLYAKNTGILSDTRTMEDIYSFYATYENTTATTADPFYYVNIDGTISYGDAVTVGPYRWIIRKTSKFGGTPSYARKMVFFDGDGETTGISLTPSPSLNGGEWYDLQGRKLSGKPTQSGVYINNGRKTIIK